MNGRLQGFLDFLDLMAEGSRRQAELIAGREFHPQPALEPVRPSASHKFPLTGHQKSRWFARGAARKVATRH